MNKDIKDYLPYYLGCEIADFSLDKNTPRKFILNANNLGYVLNTDINVNGVIKPILRPLSDMKIEEGAWCLKETYFDHIDYPISDFRLEFVGQKKNNPRVIISNDWYDWELTFGCANGSIWNTNKTLPCNTKLKATVFAYLLKQGFDLFGLIESGLAIDKTKMNSEPNDERSVATKDK